MEEQIKNILSEVLSLMGVDFSEIETKYIDETYYLNIRSKNDSSILIGRHGDNIRVLQNIIKSIFFKQNKERKYIFLDVENYREKRKNNIIELAKRKAEKVLKEGGEEMMPPMDSYDRRIVHKLFSEKEFENIETTSVGQDPDRKVNIFLKK